MNHISDNKKPLEPDLIQVELTSVNAVDKFLLVPLEKANLGEEPDIENEHFSLRLGSRPICINLLDLFLKQSQSVPASLNIFDQYDIWLINYGVSIIKTGGWQKIKQLGLEISFPSGPDDIRVTIISNMPTTSFKTFAGAELVFKANLELNGQASSKMEDIKLDQFIDLGYSGKLSLTNKSSANFSLQFNLLSPQVVSTGIGDNHSEWIVYRDQAPLLGDQLFSQTILIPKDIDSLKVKARINCLITGPMGSFPVKLAGEWNELTLWE